MGYAEIQIKVQTDFSEGQIRKEIKRLLHINRFSYRVINKSLDARNKRNIHWLVKLGVSSVELKTGKDIDNERLRIAYKKRNKRVVIAGSGPAGFFAAYLLQLSGFDTIILEKGSEVNKRARSISQFEKTGIFNPLGNYAFGEGGAGTFSDGKLTSRSKHISRERKFIIDSYISAGAPAEIACLAHPHIGTDNLRIIVKSLREKYKRNGGIINFETTLTDFKSKKGKVTEALTENELIETDCLIIAPGHSSYQTYHMMMENGVKFRTKNFALGSRVEHRQEIINRAQWGAEELKGVKAAEYRLTSEGNGKNAVYTFCMCPGGVVVPATPSKNSNIVNGMSYYASDGQFANAACVASVHPDQLAGKTVTAMDALKWLDELEHKFYGIVNGYKAPFCSIRDFIEGRMTVTGSTSSYPLGILPFPLWEILPGTIVEALREGLKTFNNRMKGYETGILLGLESKTSSPVQVLRNENGVCEGFSNLFMAGEGSGYAGGIISSAADGVKIALKLINSN